MSTNAQAILEQIKTLPPDELAALQRELEHVAAPGRPVAREGDPIRSARGMFAGSRLSEALLASRAEERRRG